MKVLQINSTVNMGSVGRRAEEIGNMLLEKGDESFIGVSSRIPRPSNSQLITIGNQTDVFFHGIKSRLFDAHAFGSKGATENFIDKIKELKPDIIHLRNLHGYYINIEVLFNFLETAGIPVVWTFYDCWAFTGHCAYFDRVNCNKWKTQCYDCPLTKAYPGSLGYDNSKVNYKRKKTLFNSVEKMVLVGTCNWIGNLIKESFLKKYPVKVIYDGVDTGVFNPNINTQFLKDKLGIEASQKIVLGSANIWDWRKGLSDFIEINKDLNDDIKILLVGLTKEQQKDLPSNIVGIDRTDSLEELATLFALADVFVNPTYVDNFPTTNLEALASGTPVVTYKTGGCPEAVDENTGIVADKGNKRELVDAILKIIKDGKDKYVIPCRKRALDNFDKTDNNEAYYDIYKAFLI